MAHGMGYGRREKHPLVLVTGDVTSQFMREQSRKVDESAVCSMTRVALKAFFSSGTNQASCPECPATLVGRPTTLRSDNLPIHQGLVRYTVAL